MTRFFKVSLSVVALLLVALVLFTGCANKALTAAEEAKQAVEDATAELEAAIAKKADADELTAKVEDLTAAIEAAKALVTDGDVALKAAIDEASKTLGDNAQTLISALDVKIAGLLAEKADKATINEQLAKLDALVTNINEVTNGAISIKDFTELSTTVAYYAYRLEVLWEDNILAYKDLYTEAQFTNLRKAYKNAETALYRATSMSVIEQAYANFEAVASAKENRNAIDTLYYDTIAPFFKDAAKKTTADAKKLYTDLKAKYEEYKTANNTLAMNALEGYYVGFFSLDTTNDAATENLLAKALILWGEKLNADVAELGNRYLVHQGADAKLFQTDAADIRAAREGINAFNGYTPSGEDAEPVAGEYDYVKAIKNAPASLKKVNDTAAFQANETRLVKLEEICFADATVPGAAAGVDFIENEVLDLVYGVPAEDEDRAEGDTLANIKADVVAAIVESEKNAEGTPMPNADVIVAINKLNKLVAAWKTDYVKAPQAGESQANMDRYNVNKAPIAEVEAVVDALYGYLYREGGAVATYKAEAQQFIDLAYVPSDIKAGIFDEHGNYDFANVKIYHGDMLAEAKALVTAWRNKWNGQVALDVYDTNKDKVVASEAAQAIMLAERSYTATTTQLVADWRNLWAEGGASAILAAYYDVVDGAFVIKADIAPEFVYETKMETALAWFDFFVANEDDAKVSMNDLKYVADQLDENEIAPSVAYYDLLKALIVKRTEMREAIAAEAKALQDRIADIKGNTIAAHLAGVTAGAEPVASPIVVALANDVAAFEAKYVAVDHDLEGYVFLLVEKDNITEAGAEFTNIVAKIAAIKAAVKDVNDLVVDDDNDVTTMNGLITAVETAVANFKTANFDEDDLAYTQAAYDVIKVGQYKIAYYEAVKAGTALDNAVTVLKDTTDAIDADDVATIIALGDVKGVTCDAYKAKIDALVAANAAAGLDEIDFSEFAGYANAYNGGVDAANKAADEAYYAAIAVLVKAELTANNDFWADKLEAIEFVIVMVPAAEQDSILADIEAYYAAAVAKVDNYTFTDAELQALVDADDKALALAAVNAAVRAADVAAFRNAVLDEVWAYGANNWADVVAAVAELS